MAIGMGTIFDIDLGSEIDEEENK
jgi:hypothetical protein